MGAQEVWYGTKVACSKQVFYL